MKKQKPFGIQMGVACLIFGVAFAAADVVIYQMGKVYPVILALTPFLILSGIAFLFMPGNEPTPETPKNLKAKTWWKISPTINKIIWTISMLVGLAIGIWLMVSLTNFD